MKWRNLNDLNRTIIESLPDIQSRGFKCVVGVPRSGMLVASLYASYLNIPLSDPVTFGSSGMGVWWRGKLLSRDWPMLLVEDSINTGTAMDRAGVQAGRSDLSVSLDNIHRLSIYGRSDSVDKGLCDQVLEVLDGPRLFEWNLWKHMILTETLSDLDGVLCPDPAPEENDDGPEYVKFIQNAPVKFRPYHTLFGIVTTRLGKYQEQTMDWVIRNDIKTRNVGMLDMPDKETRVRWGKRGEWKAEIYKRTPEAKLFLESSPTQALTISELVEKPVICTTTMEAFNVD